MPRPRNEQSATDDGFETSKSTMPRGTRHRVCCGNVSRTTRSHVWPLELTTTEPVGLGLARLLPATQCYLLLACLSACRAGLLWHTDDSMLTSLV